MSVGVQLTSELGESDRDFPEDVEGKLRSKTSSSWLKELQSAFWRIGEMEINRVDGQRKTDRFMDQ